jgi:hypothetical protein
MGVGYRRARLSALAGGGASGVGFDAASNLASAARSGSRRGAWGYRSPSMTSRIAAVYRGQLVVGAVNCRHGPDIIGRHLSSKKTVDMPNRAVTIRRVEIIARPPPL